MLGVDLDEAEEEENMKRAMSELEREALHEYHEQAVEDAKTSLDLSYYHLGN